MPGQLRSDAECPLCASHGHEVRLAGLVDTTTIGSTITVSREYFHEKGSPKARRVRKHTRTFTDFEEAQDERRSLEV